MYFGGWKGSRQEFRTFAALAGLFMAVLGGPPSTPSQGPLPEHGNPLRHREVRQSRSRHKPPRRCAGLKEPVEIPFLRPLCSLESQSDQVWLECGGE